MTFRRRITLASAAAVAIAVVLASVLVYLLTSNQLHRQIDAQLRGRASRDLGALRVYLSGAGAPAGASTGSSSSPSSSTTGLSSTQRRDLLLRRLGLTAGGRPYVRTPGSSTSSDLFRGPRPNEVLGYQQIVTSSAGVEQRSFPPVTLPVGARTRALASKGGAAFFTTVSVNGTHLRILAEPVTKGVAEQFAQPLADTDSLLSRLRLILAVLDAGGIALAAMLGLLVAGAALSPIKRLIRATEHVTHTRDLSQRIAPTGEDEIAQLAVSFNAMLDALQTSMHALDASVTAQRQLVADASHELRTPVTSLRTNIEILQQAHDMDLADRQRLLSDVVEQIEELTLLMNDLIDLARGAEAREQTEDVRLDLVVADAITRARRHAPRALFSTALEPTLVVGAPARLDRAVNNLLDNATKFSPDDEAIEVSLHGGELIVRDRGPGIAAEDLELVFDRFYRGAEARGRPGSGLGLAIVRQVAEAHGGSISAERATGGGTLMRLRLNTVAVDDEGAPPSSDDSPAADRAPATV
jgi:two-component system sensor histidine kinase MprB